MCMHTHMCTVTAARQFPVIEGGRAALCHLGFRAVGDAPSEMPSTMTDMFLTQDLGDDVILAQIPKHRCAVFPTSRLISYKSGERPLKVWPCYLLYL